jgi:hypothetical protein
MHLKLLEKQETKPKNSRQKETIDIRSEINKMETKRTIQSMKQESWFFENTNKIDKPLVILTKGKEERTKTNRIRDEKVDITTNTKEIQRIIREDLKNLYSNRMEN